MTIPNFRIQPQVTTSDPALVALGYRAAEIDRKLERIAEALEQLVEQGKPAGTVVFNQMIEGPKLDLAYRHEPPVPAYRDEPVLIAVEDADREFDYRWSHLMDYHLDEELDLPSGWRVLKESAVKDLGEFRPAPSGKLVHLADGSRMTLIGNSFAHGDDELELYETVVTDEYDPSDDTYYCISLDGKRGDWVYAVDLGPAPIDEPLDLDAGVFIAMTDAWTADMIWAAPVEAHQLMPDPDLPYRSYPHGGNPGGFYRVSEDGLRELGLIAE